jgi:hypothetical protein
MVDEGLSAAADQAPTITGAVNQRGVVHGH